MKSTLILFTFLFSSVFAFAQGIPSSCTAPDSIIESYQNDADLLALLRINRNQNQYVDSVQIPTSFSNPLLDALLAVYNVSGMPERDTVVDVYNIHAFSYLNLNEFGLTADSTLSWMQELKAGNFPTGNNSVDSILLEYDFSLTNYFDYGQVLQPTAYFHSDSNLNIAPILNYLESLQGVYWASINGWGGDGNTISDSVYTDHIELIYSIGWGDCPAGCIFRRYWKFKVYDDCSVEFVESYGPSISTSIEDLEMTQVIVFPNPFVSQISLEGLASDVDYEIVDLQGRIVKTGQSNRSQITNLDGLTNGSYVLRLIQDDISRSFQLMK